MPNNTTMLNLAVGYAKVYLHLFVYFVHPLLHIETFYYTSNIVSELSISPNTNSMHRSIAGYNPYNLFSLTIDYSKNFTTNKVLTKGRMPMFVVKSIVI